MKVVLLENIKKMGAKGDIIAVSDGYANSYLIPRKLATVATDREQKISRQMQEEKNIKKQRESEHNEQLFKRINKKTINIVSPANTQGHLFAAISKTDITSQIPGLTPEHVVLKKPLKELGEYELPILIGDQKGKIIANIASQ